MRDDSFKHAPLRHGDVFLARLFAVLLLAALVLVSSLFDINSPQESSIANEVGFSLLFLLPLAAVFYWMFTVARTGEKTWLEQDIMKRQMRTFTISFVALIALVLIDEFSGFSSAEVWIRLLAAIATFVASVYVVLSFPFEKSFILFVAASVFTLLAILPYNNVVAGMLRGQPLLWILSMLPFIATAPAGFEKIVHILRARYRAQHSK